MRLIPRVERISGEVTVPASKSYTARALLLASMSTGSTTVLNSLDCDDSRFMLEALKKAGFETSGSFTEGITIGDRKSISANDVELFVGNAGTAMRFLAGYLCFLPGRFLLTGDQRMLQRPIGDLVEALRSVGSEIEYAGSEGFPPLQIRGKRMRGGFEIDVSGRISSQFVSSIMMAASTLPGGVRVRADALVSRPYVDITKEILTDFGAHVDEEGEVIRIVAPNLERDRYVVEGDYSSASYWFAAAAATAGVVSVAGLRRDSSQGDRRFLDILTTLGSEVEWTGDLVTVRGPEQLSGGSFDLNDAPDIVPTLAAIAPLATSPIEITNVANLRVKESDRLAVVATELRKLGAAVSEGSDLLRIEPGWPDHPAVIEPHGDHRIAMSFAVAGLRRGNVTIDDERVVSKSYPRFWRTFDELVAATIPLPGDRTEHD